VREVNVTIRQDDSGEVTAEVRLPPEAERPGALPSEAWVVLSPLTYRVVRLLCVVGWMSREEIAQRLGEQPDGKLGPLLTDLAERHLLESSPRKGYHLAIPESAEPEAFRARVIAWIDRGQSNQSDP
jgi:hypothetical protein